MTSQSCFGPHRLLAVLLEAATMDDTHSPHCAHCGGASVVRIGNMQRAVYLCLACYDQECASPSGLFPTTLTRNYARIRTQIGAAMVTVGTILASTAAVVDFLSIGNHPGFGWNQVVAVATGVSLTACGVLFRIGVLAAVGAVMVAAGLLTDVLALGNSPGFGWKQTAGVFVAGVLITVGSVLSIWKGNPTSEADSPPDEGAPPLTSPGHAALP